MRCFYTKRIVVFCMIVISTLFIKFCYNPSPQDGSNSVDEILTHLSKYIVDSPKCKIPNLNPFNKSILHLVKKVERNMCAKYPPLTKVTYNTLTGQHTLEVDSSAISYYTNSTQFQCCVQRLYKFSFIDNSCQFFIDEFLMNKINEFVIVYCFNEKGEEIYQNIHAATVSVKRFNRRKKEREKDPNKLNVLLIGFDSMSRLNFYRTMPRTSVHLHTHGWVEMRGYNKIADNTLPNMMAFLTGLSPENFKKAQHIYFDDMPFIWKEFSSAGYVTAYAEDQPVVSTFHGHLKGFRNYPTDHYFWEYMLVGELLFMGGNWDPGCIAYKSGTEHLFDYLLDFVTVYKNDPFFGLFWLNQLSHNNLNRASGEDDHVLDILEHLIASGTMNSTMVILMSDHGLRTGDFRKTKQGWYEDRLPLLFISIPEWYKTQNPFHYRNLLENSEKLTSPYDLHLTIQHILYGRPKMPPSRSGCKTCHSLLSEVPPNRSCQEAGISPHWCTCHPLSDVPYSDMVLHVADYIIQTINEKLARDPDIQPYFVCEELKLRNALYLREKINQGVKELVVGFSTDPGGAEFEGTVVVHEHYLTVEDSISRLNDYGSESSCADNPISKLFCYCKQVML